MHAEAKETAATSVAEVPAGQAAHALRSEAPAAGLNVPEGQAVGALADSPQ